MAPVWEAVRNRLESQGDQNRGRVRVPELASSARFVLRGLLGREPTATLDLALLEQALARVGVGSDLPTALAAVGFAVSSKRADARAVRQARAEAHDAARAGVAAWDEPWAPEWVAEAIRSGVFRGLDSVAAMAMVGDVRRVLTRVSEAVQSGALLSRTDLAATVLGSSHALDSGSPMELACSRALARAQDDADTGGVWDGFGVHTDLVSGPVLTWALPITSDAPLGRIIGPATELGVPLHLTREALLRYPVRVRAGTVILVVENPRVVEAAAQRSCQTPVVTTNGNPSAAVRLLLGQLLGSGAMLRYHGDFDVPGLAICERMQRLGLRPWQMDAEHYRAAVAAASLEGVDLPHETRTVSSTPWDPRLADAMNELGRIVHEERLLDDLLS